MSHVVKRDIIWYSIWLIANDGTGYCASSVMIGRSQDFCFVLPSLRGYGVDEFWWKNTYTVRCTHKGRKIYLPCVYWSVLCQPLDLFRRMHPVTTVPSSGLFVLLFFRRCAKHIFLLFSISLIGNSNRLAICGSMVKSHIAQWNFKLWPAANSSLNQLRVFNVQCKSPTIVRVYNIVHWQKQQLTVTGYSNQQQLKTCFSCQNVLVLSQSFLNTNIVLYEWYIHIYYIYNIFVVYVLRKQVTKSWYKQSVYIEYWPTKKRIVIYNYHNLGQMKYDGRRWFTLTSKNSNYYYGYW